MADDAPTFFEAAMAIAIPPHARRQPVAFRTLLSTDHAYDAGVCGFDGPSEIGVDGSFAVHFDGRGSIPSVIVNGDGEVQVCGLAAMEALSDAILDAVKLARRQVGQ